MSTQGIFHLRGNTKVLKAGAGRPGETIQMSVIAGMPPASDYTITNLGPGIAYVGWGPDADTAIENAREPTTAEPRFCVVVYPGQRTIEAKHNVYFAASTASGTTTLLISPGQGLVDGFGAGNVLEQTDSLALLGLLAHIRGSEQETLDRILVELRVITNFIKQGLNVAEEPDIARGDETANIN